MHLKNIGIRGSNASYSMERIVNSVNAFEGFYLLNFVSFDKVGFFWLIEKRAYAYGEMVV